MTNRTTLAQLREMDVKEAATLPIDHLSMLLEEVAELRTDAKRLSDLLADALHARFGTVAAEARVQDGKLTGRVRIPLEGFEVVADLPKKVEWDQEKLRTALTTLQEWEEDPKDYVSTEIRVSETRFNAWPPKIRALFEPARTLAAGKPVYVIEQKGAR